MPWQIDKAFGFDTAVEEAQRALMAAKVEASSAYRGVGLVKLAGRQSGFIAVKVSRSSVCPAAGWCEGLGRRMLHGAHRDPLQAGCILSCPVMCASYVYAGPGGRMGCYGAGVSEPMGSL